METSAIGFVNQLSKTPAGQSNGVSAAKVAPDAWQGRNLGLEHGADGMRPIERPRLSVQLDLDRRCLRHSRLSPGKL